ncbi:MAG: TIGR03084 family metal-binding protein [Ilumatobacteraceae bacterium]
MNAICDDLTAEHDDFDRIVGALDVDEWDLATPSPGWMVRDQISHLWFFDQRALLALTDAEGFAADTAVLMKSGGTDTSIRPGREMTAAALLDAWRAGRSALVAAARGVDPAARIPWYGPAMGARSFITARLMETWAHGQDVVDAVGASREPSARLRHVAHIGVGARRYSYRINQLELPDSDVYVGLDSPAGELWEWGTPGADSVTGSAIDFCLAVTQRRALADTSLTIRGASAVEWMSIAQAFAGGPGKGRDVGAFRGR